MPPVAIDQLLSKVVELSTLPEVTRQILAITEDPNSTARDLNEVLRHDMALSSKILRVVNSAFYGLPGRVADLDRAIVLLGFQAVRNLSIAATMAALFRKPETEGDGFDIKRLWRHSVATAVAAKSIATTIGSRNVAEEAFLAGIIHDLGVLVLYQYAQKEFLKAVELLSPDVSLLQAERELFSGDHQSVGQDLAKRWKFPRSLQLVAGYHHRPQKLSDELRMLPSIVAMAGYVADETGHSFLTGGAVESKGTKYAEVAEAIGLTAEQQRQIMGSMEELVRQADAWLEM